MGVCLQKPRISIREQKVIKNQIERQSFLYNSFTYDPSLFNQQEKFFFFDLPHYCQIQYILRKTKFSKQKQIQQVSSDNEKRTKQLISNLEQHINQIEEAIIKFNDDSYKNILKQLQQTSQLSSNSKDNQLNEKKLGTTNNFLKFDAINQNIKQRQQIQYNYVLNFELISANLNVNEQDQINYLEFKIFLNQSKITCSKGLVKQGKWKPQQSNQISISNIQIDLQSEKMQNKMYKSTNIKLIANMDDEQIECTIPLNKITFKYIIPVMQTANIRTRQDKEPIGHLNFKIQYVQKFQQHRNKVINDLEARKKALTQIIQNIKNKNVDFQDKTLILQQYNQSFLSETGMKIV